MYTPPQPLYTSHASHALLQLPPIPNVRVHRGAERARCQSIPGKLETKKAVEILFCLTNDY